LCIIQSSPKVILFSLVLTSKNSFVRDIYCLDGKIDKFAN